MKNLRFPLVLALVIPLAAISGCLNSEPNYQDRMPESKQNLQMDTDAKVNNKLDSAKRMIETARDTVTVGTGR